MSRQRTNLFQSAFTPPPEAIDQRWRQLHFPVPDDFVAEFDPPDQEHLWQITQAQFVPEAPEDNQRDDIGRVLSAVENSTAALIESLSGHIPRSSLRSSDLLPFYHQYPAACCGDFLFAFHKHGTGSAGNRAPFAQAVRKLPPHRTQCTAFPVPSPRRIIRRQGFIRPVDLGATDDRTARTRSRKSRSP
jgi:hypothetical protein